MYPTWGGGLLSELPGLCLPSPIIYPPLSSRTTTSSRRRLPDGSSPILTKVSAAHMVWSRA
eukprot:5952184-Alexandrium_andersonii.AAC.1